MKMRSVFAAAAFCCLAAATASAAPPFALHNGDRVVFYGDSITEQHLYTNYIEDYVTTRFPSLKVIYFNAGVGGDRVTGGWAGPIDLRLQRDVIPFKPTVLTSMLGMNDAGYQPYNPGLFHTYTTGYQHILSVLKDHFPKLRITLIQPSPFDDYTRPVSFPGGYNAVLLRYADYVSKLAQSEDALCTNFNAPMVSMLQKAAAADPSLAQKLVPDRVHPSPAGHLIMAEALLKTWNAPALVTAAAVDASNKTAATDNCVISDIAYQNGTLSWTEKDGSLPFPLNLKDPLTRLVLQSSHFLQNMDAEPLKVTGLPEGSYTLKIDSTTVGVFTSEQLEDGINLSNMNTPMLQQALQVDALTQMHSNIHMTEWRSIEMPVQGKVSDKDLERADNALNQLDVELQVSRRKAAAPVVHNYQIVKE